MVGIEDAGLNNEITNKALLEIFTNVTNYHGYLIGQGTGHLDEMPLAWMVTNWKFEIFSRPTVCHHLTARTWAHEYTRAFAWRDYEAFDEEDRRGLDDPCRFVEGRSDEASGSHLKASGGTETEEGGCGSASSEER